MTIIYLVSDRGITIHQQGGAGTKVRETINSFKSMGHNVYTYIVGDIIVKSRKNVSLSSYIVKQYSHGILRKSGAMIRNILTNYHTYSELLKLAQLKGPDLIYERSSYLSLNGVKLKKDLQVPLVLEWTGPLELEWSEIYKSRFMESISKYYEDIKYKQADVIVMPSKASLKFLNPKYYNKVVISGLGVNVDMFDSDRNDPHKIRKRLGLSDTECLIGYVGTFAWYHGIEAMVKALNVLKTKGINFKAVLIGEGKQRSLAEQYVIDNELRDSVIFPGMVEYKDIPNWLSAIDIAVLPDCTEYIYPEKLLEYGASGCAVIAPNRQVIRELLTDHEDAILIKPRDCFELSNALEELISNSELRDTLANNLKNKVMKEYSWAKIWKEVLLQTTKILEINP